METETDVYQRLSPFNMSGGVALESDSVFSEMLSEHSVFPKTPKSGLPE